MTTHRLVLTAVGQDAPGLVAGLTDLICQHHGNIEDSTMTRLAGQFAMILILSLPASVTVEAFSEQAQQVAVTLGLQVHLSTLPPPTESNTPSATGRHSHPSNNPTNDTRPFLVSVAGADHTGITHAVSQLLARYQANITDLNAHRIEGDEGPVYVMVVEFDLPNTQLDTALQQDLDQLAQAQHLDIRLRSVDVLPL